MKKLLSAGFLIICLLMCCLGCNAAESTPATTATTTPVSNTPSTSVSHTTSATPSSPAVTTSEPAPQSVTVVDVKGRSVEVKLPVNRIVSITQGASTLLCALGAGDKIVGRDSNSVVPSLLLEVPEVAGSSYDPNVERVLELQPDVVIADTMLKDANIDMFTSHGIAVIIDSPSDINRLFTFINNTGLILNETAKAQKIIADINYYRDLVKERVSGLTDEEKPTVFYEWNKPYYSASGKSVFHGTLVEAGARNIAENESASYPQLSAEWVMQANPDYIIRMASGNSNTLDDLIALRSEIMSRAELKNVTAVKNENVYILGYGVTNGLRYSIGLLYCAKYFHPDLFTDIDPLKVHEELVTKYFGAEEWQNNTTAIAFAYPEP
jgi:iron complex transport system substrate-binding protein